MVAVMFVGLDFKTLVAVVSGRVILLVLYGGGGVYIESSVPDLLRCSVPCRAPSVPRRVCALPFHHAAAEQARRGGDAESARNACVWCRHGSSFSHLGK